jgi:hypothetical protein
VTNIDDTRWEDPRDTAGGATDQPEPADHWPAGKTFGDLTPRQRQAAIRRAGDQLSAELVANAETIGRILADPEGA